MVIVIKTLEASRRSKNKSKNKQGVQKKHSGANEGMGNRCMWGIR